MDAHCTTAIEINHRPYIAKYIEAILDFSLVYYSLSTLVVEDLIYLLWSRSGRRYLTQFFDHQDFFCQTYTTMGWGMDDGALLTATRRNTSAQAQV
jgi:hypothetical protein